MWCGSHGSCIDGSCSCQPGFSAFYAYEMPRVARSRYTPRRAAGMVHSLEMVCVRSGFSGNLCEIICRLSITLETKNVLGMAVVPSILLVVCVCMGGVAVTAPKQQAQLQDRSGIRFLPVVSFKTELSSKDGTVLLQIRMPRLARRPARLCWTQRQLSGIATIPGITTVMGDRFTRRVVW